MKARIHNGHVVEILTPIEGFKIEDCFHADVLDQCVDAGDLKIGDKYPPDIQVEPVEPKPEPTPDPTPTPTPST